MIRRTAWALVTNLSGSSFILLCIALFTVGALVSDDERAASYNLLMSFGFVAALAAGLLSGTTLTEIKVKPLSYVLPGQERSMAPAVVLLGALVSLVYALLLLGQPMAAVAVPAWQQSLGAFAFAFGLFTFVVALCLLTHNTPFVSSVATIPPLLVIPAAFGHETIASAWLALNAAVAQNSLLALSFAAGGLIAVFRLLGQRSHSRRLCGAPFLPLKAYDNPFQLDAYRQRMKSSAFRRSVMTDSRPSLVGVALTALSRRAVGSSWDYLVFATRGGGNLWESTFKFAAVALLIGFLALYVPSDRLPDPLVGLTYLVFVTFMCSPPTFKPRLSPMPPVSRSRYFGSFLAKAAGLYVLTIIATLLLLLVIRIASEGAPGYESAMATAWAGLPLRAVFVVAATVPILCWAFAALRSAIGFLVFSIAFVAVLTVVAKSMGELLLAQSYAAVILTTAVCWLPFVLIARKRCLKDDLLRL